MTGRTLCITGKSALKVKTDWVRIAFTVRENDIAYGEAFAALTETVNGITDIIVKNGFEKKDLKTSDFDVRKETKYNKRTEEYDFISYCARETMTLSFPIDNKKINNILSALQNEMDEVEFNISFFCHDPSRYENELISLAVRDAKEKAAIIANASGVSLKQIERLDYSFSEIHIENTLEFDYNVKMCCDAPDIAGIPDMEPDDTELTKTITIVWEIE